MKFQYYKCSEAGIYLPFFALILITLLALVGLVLDAGILFIRKNELQVIADMSNQAALGYRTLKGWSYFHNDNFSDLGVNGALDNEVKSVAEGVITQNLLARGINISTTSASVSYGGATDLTYGTFTDRISVNLSMNVPLMIMGHVPGLLDCNGSGCTVSVNSEAQLQPANILIDIDVSGSMRCPDNDADDPPCQCRKDPISPGCAAIASNELKINKLKAANGPLMTFIKFFNPNRDRIGIIPFNTTADVALSILGPTNRIQEIGAKIPQIQTTIANLTAAGNTNSSDALWRSFLDISSANPAVVGREPFFLVLFSDGADTAGRFAYDQDLPITPTPTPQPTPPPRPKATGATLDSKILLLRENDWTSYKIEWTATNGSTWVGPSPLINTSVIPKNFTGVVPDPLWPPQAVCGRRLIENPANLDPARLHMESDPARLHLELRDGPDADPTTDCLQSFGFLGAFQTTRRVGHTIGQTDEASDYIGANSSYYYLQQYSHASLEIADYIRSQGGIVYAIGLGPKASTTVGATLNSDPHQNILRDFEQKTYFFERLTADVYHASTLPTLTYGFAHPGFEQRNIVINDPKDSRNGRTISVGYAGHRDWNWVEQNVTEDKRGEYLQADNVEQLSSRFTRVAKQILLRLIQ